MEIPDYETALFGLLTTLVVIVLNSFLSYKLMGVYESQGW